MAKTAGPYDIRVNAPSAGATLTEATRKVVPAPMLEKLGAVKATGRNPEPGDLTHTGLIPASDDGTLMTGQTLVVDAGEVMVG